MNPLPIYIDTHRQTDRHREIERHTERYRDRERHRQTDRQTDRQWYKISEFVTTSVHRLDEPTTDLHRHIETGRHRQTQR